MPDDKRKRGKPDRSRVSITERHERAYWSKRLGCSQTALVLAVRYCGYRFDREQDSIEAVESVVRDARAFAKKR